MTYMLMTIFIVHVTVSIAAATIDSIRSKLDRKEDVEILNWLTPVEYGPQPADDSPYKPRGFEKKGNGPSEFGNGDDTASFRGEQGCAQF
jgi:hypothetical protein